MTIIGTTAAPYVCTLHDSHWLMCMLALLYHTLVCMRFLFTLLYIPGLLASLGGASTQLHDEHFFNETFNTFCDLLLVFIDG